MTPADLPAEPVKLICCLSKNKGHEIQFRMLLMSVSGFQWTTDKHVYKQWLATDTNTFHRPGGGLLSDHLLMADNKKQGVFFVYNKIK